MEGDQFSRICKAHDLIEVALGDFRDFLSMPKHRGNMYGWLNRTWDGYCEACLAGAVMFCTLQLRPTVSGDLWGVLPCHADPAASIRLLAIDDLRVGKVCSALLKLGSSLSTITSLRDCHKIRPWEQDRVGFVEDMRRLQTQLEELNL